MPVTENLQALGDWSLTLRADTPRSVRDRLTAPFSHLVVTSVPLSLAAAPDAALLAAARYTGVVLRPGPGFTLSGCGLGWWLGDADGGGAVFTAPFVTSAATFQTAIVAALSTVLDTGTIETLGGSYSMTAQWVSRRTIIDAICTAFDAEWRVNPDFTFDAGTVATLYGTTAGAVAVRKGGGKDLTLPGIEAAIALETDFEQYASNIVVIGKSKNGTATGTATWRDWDAATFHRTKVFEAAQDVAAGSESAVAASLLARYEVTDGRREVSLSTAQFDINGVVRVGELCYVYDPDQGLFDGGNEARFAGEPIWPVLARVMSSSWPIERGLGVYHRATSTGGAVWTDLTDYVEWDGPGARLEVVAGPAASRFVDEAPARRVADRVNAGGWDTYTPTWTAVTTNPVIGNGTLAGRYRREGTTLHITVQMTAGSTTTFGSGAWAFSLPSGMTGGASVYHPLAGFCFDSSGIIYRATGYAVAAGSTFSVIGNDAGAGVTSTSPFAWASGDVLVIGGTMEIAP